MHAERHFTSLRTKTDFIRIDVTRWSSSLFLSVVELIELIRSTAWATELKIDCSCHLTFIKITDQFLASFRIHGQRSKTMFSMLFSPSIYSFPTEEEKWVQIFQRRRPTIPWAYKAFCNSIGIVRLSKGISRMRAMDDEPCWFGAWRTEGLSYPNRSDQTSRRTPWTFSGIERFE